MKTKQKALLIVGFCLAGLWLYRLHHQQEQLNQIEKDVSQAMQLIGQGELRNVGQQIVRLEAAAALIRSKWSALPYIRRRAESCTSQLPKLREAHQKRLTLVETTAVSVNQSVRAGKLDEAEAILKAAVKEAGKADANLNALAEFLSLFKVGNLMGAKQSARILTDTLTQHVPLGQTAALAITNYSDVVQLRSTLIETTAVSVVQSVRAGNLDEAETVLKAAGKGVGQADANLIALTSFLSRFKVQDFKGADEAAKKLAGILRQNVHFSQTAALAMTNYCDVVQVEKKANYESHVRIASEVKTSMNLSSSRESSNFRPTLKGRAMIWDSTKDAIDMAYELLPDNLRASSRDAVVTIFCIGRRENIVQGYYSVSRQPAYKEKMSIGVVYWPAKENAGTAIVWGGNPAQRRPVTYSPGYGSSVNIRDWIASLPTE